MPTVADKEPYRASEALGRFQSRSRPLTNTQSMADGPLCWIWHSRLFSRETSVDLYYRDRFALLGSDHSLSVFSPIHQRFLRPSIPAFAAAFGLLSPSIMI